MILMHNKSLKWFHIFSLKISQQKTPAFTKHSADTQLHETMHLLSVVTSWQVRLQPRQFFLQFSCPWLAVAHVQTFVTEPIFCLNAQLSFPFQLLHQNFTLQTRTCSTHAALNPGWLFGQSRHQPARNMPVYLHTMQCQWWTNNQHDKEQNTAEKI